MRVTYLTGQEPASVDLGPVIVPGVGGAASLPVGVQGQLVGYGPNGVPVAVNAPDGSAYDDTVVSGRLDAVEADLAAIPAAYDDTALAGRVTSLEEAPAPSWDDITGKPTVFTPAVHGHSIGDVSGLGAALDGKAPSSHSHAWSEITNKPTTFAPSAHTHAWDEITSKPTTFAASAHGHSVADVSGLQTALDGKQPTTTFKTVNGQAVTGTGNIVTAQSFATDAEALAYSTANPGVVVFSRQVT